MKKTIKVLLPILVIVFLLSSPYWSCAQIILKKRSVIGMGGISKNVMLNGKSYYLQQSIGQSGIIGTSDNNNIVVIQGFIFPEMMKNLLSIPKDIDIEIKSLPFSDIYVISIHDPSISSYSVSLFNINGQKIYGRKYINASEFEINLNSFKSGCYFLLVFNQNRKFSTKFIKK
jgi:hypothetical protein